MVHIRRLYAYCSNVWLINEDSLLISFNTKAKMYVKTTLTTEEVLAT